MKKLLILMGAAFISAAMFAQTLEIPIANIGSTFPVSIGVTNAVTSNFTWTKTGGNSVITNAFPVTENNVTTSSQTLTINPAVTVGMSATVSVTAVNSAATGCATAAASNLTVSIVNTPTYTASISVPTQSVCQGSTAANISVTISGPVGSTINSFGYTIDGVAQTPVTVGVVIPAGGSIISTIDMSGFSTATAGTSVVAVTSVTGTNAGIPLTSGQSGVTQTITINAIPVLGNFSF